MKEDKKKERFTELENIILQINSLNPDEFEALVNDSQLVKSVFIRIKEESFASENKNLATENYVSVFNFLKRFNNLIFLSSNSFKPLISLVVIALILIVTIAYEFFVKSNDLTRDILTFDTNQKFYDQKVSPLLFQQYSPKPPQPTSELNFNKKTTNDSYPKLTTNNKEKKQKLGVEKISFASKIKQINKLKEHAKTTSFVREKKNEFIMVNFAGNTSLNRGVQIVRVELTQNELIKLGLLGYLSPNQSQVKADILFGEDGLLKGVRFVK